MNNVPLDSERMDGMQQLDLKAFHAELDSRPRLRGRLHAITAFASVIGLIILVRSANDFIGIVSAWVFGLTSIALYATSSSYHILARSPRARTIMQRADHTMIYILIAGKVGS